MLNDSEISQKAREAEESISAIINTFVEETGIDTFSPEINFCMEGGIGDSLRMKNVAHFYLHASKTF